MTDLKTKLAALHQNMTPGTWMTEHDPVSAQDHATLIELPGKAGSPGTLIARTEHNWNDASYNERRVSWKEAETNAEWIALTGSEANRAQIIAALDAVEECERLRDVVRVAAKWFEQAVINHEIAAEVAGPNENAAYVEAARRDTFRGQFLRAALDPRP